jgi:malonyl-CoA/methylmalonyl-CoA synthetase
MAVSMLTLPLLARAAAWPERLALVEPGATATYGELLDASARLAGRLLAGRSDLGEERVAYLVSPGVCHVETQWAIWRAGAVAVPLAASQAPAEWDYIVADTGAAQVIGDGGADVLRSIAAARGATFLDAGPRAGHSAGPVPLPGITSDRRAMILYTSGTTSRPKGVVTTHRNVEAQITALVHAWGWASSDRILHVLPLNHVHGIVNVLACALWAGAVCEFLAPFEPHTVWNRMAGGGVTLFMAVPTIYARLLAAWDSAADDVKARWSEAADGLRLMVSGSAALPAPLLERWRKATGQVLLERYGMTEIGMALSNPLSGPRRPGCVGLPLPGVDVRLVDETGRAVPTGTPGEIEVRGDSVFLEYWGRPDATRDAFREGWFRTGDVAVVDEGSYRILGRQSVDIIKTGGYKVSALEIEDVLCQHPDVRECAVVGIADDEWGERVAVAIVAGADDAPSIEALREWAGSRLARYKLPTRLQKVDELPRNPMGKVVKARVKELF